MEVDQKSFDRQVGMLYRIEKYIFKNILKMCRHFKNWYTSL